MSSANRLPIYTPGLQSGTEIEDNFIVRNRLFDRLLNEVKTGQLEYPEQHYFIQGERGMGKTTLLLRLGYAVRHDVQLREKIIPLVFKEEEYGINHLYRFWERIIELMEDQGLTKNSTLTDYHQLSEATIKDDEYEKKLYQLLATHLRDHSQKLLLLVDNFTTILEKFSTEEAHRLRKILQISADLRIIGADTHIPDSFFVYQHPFYEFFKIIRLRGLDTKETQILINQLVNNNASQQRTTSSTSISGSIEAIRRLTGGTIRHLVLLSEILAKNPDGSAMSHLENLLDRLTPIYKTQMDQLPTQQQQIVEIIALFQKAISVKEISQQLRLESKVISAQLNQLVKNNVITKIKTSTKNNFYQINDRVFNYWFILRLGRPHDRKKVEHLLRFLENWCEHPLISEDYLMEVETFDFPTPRISGMADCLVTDSASRPGILRTRSRFNQDEEFLTKAKQAIQSGQIQMGLTYLQKMKKPDHFLIGQIYHQSISDFSKAVIHYQKAARQGDSNASNNLGVIYEIIENNIPKAIEHYQEAANQDHVNGHYNLGLQYARSGRAFRKAETHFQKTIELGSTTAYLPLAYVYQYQLNDPEQARYYLEQAANEGSPSASYQLAMNYLTKEGDILMARSYFLDYCQAVSETPEILKVFPLLFLLAQEAYGDLRSIFTSTVQEACLPVYYALLKIDTSQAPDESLRMGQELEETVEEIMEFVEEMKG